jgi:hypothetical protein
MTTIQAQTIAVTPERGKYFWRGVSYAKRAGGKYDGSVWRLPVIQFGRPNPIAANPRNYYLRLVDQGTCRLYTRDQGCPLHGETCAPEYN